MALAICLLSAHYVRAEQVAICASTGSMHTVSALPSVQDIIKGIFKKDKAEKPAHEKVMVYPGGQPLGFTLECDGVLVVAIGSVQTASGEVKPLENKNIKVGDVIASVDGTKITSAAHMQSLVSLKKGENVVLEVERDGKRFVESVVPALEASTSSFRLGLWIRDNAAGVGTLTFVREDLRFGALGHPISDIDTSKTLPVAGGYAYKCTIVGCKKGQRGTPGELRGLFLKTNNSVGELDSNNEFGVYGYMDKSFIENEMTLPLTEVGFSDSVKTGKATIYTTVDGTRPREYSIEIIKLSHQINADKKSMVIRVTDSELINQTGGIVQGMSGSPILQNGKIVGAVTHVFINDPTKGFGVYMDYMLDN